MNTKVELRAVAEFYGTTHIGYRLEYRVKLKPTANSILKLLNIWRNINNSPLLTELDFELYKIRLKTLEDIHNFEKELDEIKLQKFQDMNKINRFLY